MVDFRQKGETYDVAIPGSGLGGSALAAILAPLLAPLHNWSDPEQLHLDFTPDRLMRFIGWGTEAPAELRDRRFDFHVAVLGGMTYNAHAVPVHARTPREQFAVAMA